MVCVYACIFKKRFEKNENFKKRFEKNELETEEKNQKKNKEKNEMSFCLGRRKITKNKKKLVCCLIIVTRNTKIIKFNSISLSHHLI